MKLQLIILLSIAQNALSVPFAEERQYVDPVEFRQYVDPIEFREIHPSQATFGETNIYRVLEETSADQEERITSYPLTLHGGPVMATPNAYIIWYGTWTTAAQNPILNFVSTVGATPWWAINKPYGVGSLVYKKAVADNYSQGKTLTTSTVWASVYNAINKGLLPLDTNAIYLVLSSSDVTISGFCTSFCGWHTYAGSGTSTYKFAWIGIPPSTCNCYAQKTASPNGNPAVDAAISVIGHELAEAATDPTGGGYCYSGTATSCFSSGAVENGDQCAWYFPNAVSTGTYSYNLVIGTAKYYVQANWNLSKKLCTMS